VRRFLGSKMASRPTLGDSDHIDPNASETMVSVPFNDLPLGDIDPIGNGSLMVPGEGGNVRSPMTNTWGI